MMQENERSASFAWKLPSPLDASIQWNLISPCSPPASPRAIGNNDREQPYAEEQQPESTDKEDQDDLSLTALEVLTNDKEKGMETDILSATPSASCENDDQATTQQQASVDNAVFGRIRTRTLSESLGAATAASIRVKSVLQKMRERTLSSASSLLSGSSRGQDVDDGDFSSDDEDYAGSRSLPSRHSSFRMPRSSISSKSLRRFRSYSTASTVDSVTTTEDDDDDKQNHARRLSAEQMKMLLQQKATMCAVKASSWMHMRRTKSSPRPLRKSYSTTTSAQDASSHRFEV